MTSETLDGALGTRLRAVLDAMDADVARTLVDLGLTDYRTRYSPVLRAIADGGPRSIRELATAIGVTHSAISQTVTEMARRGLVELVAGADARQRVVHATTKAKRLMPKIDAEWAATQVATSALDAELSAPLATIVAELTAALEARPFRQRIADAASTMARLDPSHRRAIAAKGRRRA